MRWFAHMAAFSIVIALTIAAQAQPSEPAQPAPIAPESKVRDASTPSETPPSPNAEIPGPSQAQGPAVQQEPSAQVAPSANLPPNETKKPSAPKPRRLRLSSGESGSDPLIASMKPPSHRCFVRDVMAFYDRTHVRCYNRAKNVLQYFAVDTSQPVAETVLTKAWRSMRSGRPLTITYAPSADLNPSNCAASNCRRLLDVLN